MSFAKCFFLGAFVAALIGLSSAGAAHAACEAPPQAIIDFNAKSYYVDQHHSVVDPTLKAESEANEKPVEDFKKGVARSASDYARGKNGAGECALTWLSAWAGQGAFLGSMASNQAYYTQKWLLASTALSYARVRDRATQQTRAQIENWLRALADRVVAHATQDTKERNNHYYWSGLAVAAVGAITGNPNYLNFAAGVFDTAMSQIQSDGSLPLELDRGVKASQYHSFATEALVMLSSILNRDSPQLDRLVAFTYNSANDPSSIAQKTGFQQESVSPKSLEWLRIYLRRHPNPQIGAFEASQKPGFVQNLGGYLDIPNPLEHPSR